MSERPVAFDWGTLAFGRIDEHRFFDNRSACSKHAQVATAARARDDIEQFLGEQCNVEALLPPRIITTSLDEFEAAWSGHRIRAAGSAHPSRIPRNARRSKTD